MSLRWGGVEVALSELADVNVVKSCAQYRPVLPVDQ